MYHEHMIIGAGPIGLELAANFSLLGLDYLQFDAGCLGDTIARWPADTPFFSSPERVAIAGVSLQTRHQGLVCGEEYLSYLRAVTEQHGLNPLLYHRVVNAKRIPGEGFMLEVEHAGQQKEYRCRKLFLAQGNMHAPRRLGIEGEELEHVDHYHRDVHRYFRQKLLVVGGRNSAVETAIRAWRAGAEVTLLHRGSELKKEKLNSRYHLEISILINKGMIRFLPESELVRIAPGRAWTNRGEELEADFVRICAGFDKDLGLFHQLGIPLDADRRPLINEQSMMTLVPDVYVAGTAAGGGVDSYRIFVGTSHVHVERIVGHLNGRSAVVGDFSSRVYPFSHRDIESVEGNVR